MIARIALLLALAPAAAIGLPADDGRGAGLPELRIVPNACPRTGEPDEITVCGRRDRNSRYRLPLLQDGFNPDGPVESVARERERLMEGGETGIDSCSTVGPGGWTGCMLQGIERRRQQEGH